MNKLYLSALLVFPLLMSCTTEPDEEEVWDAAKVCPETVDGAESELRCGK